MLSDAKDMHNNIQESEIKGYKVERTGAGTNRCGLGYRLFCSYIRFFHNNICYRKVEALGRRNVPPDCPMMVISNHQNGMFDTLGLLLTIPRKKRKVITVARADMFGSPMAAKALKWLGLVPAFRLSVDGEDSLKNNDEIFEGLEDEMLQGGTIIMFPEASEVHEHRLRDMSPGYLHILFNAASKSGFERDIIIQPSCNHYSEYRRMRSAMVVKYGEPISLKPYYELYQKRPRTAKRQIHALVKERIAEMMLDISDADNYNSIDFLRKTYGVSYARRNGFKPRELSSKLLSDKQFYAGLERAAKRDPEKITGIYRLADRVRDAETEMGLEDINMAKRRGIVTLTVRMLVLITLLPIFIVCFAPSLLVVILPKLASRKIEVPVLRAPMEVVINMVALIPLTAIILFLSLFIALDSWIIALAAVAAAPFMGVGAWYYYRAVRRTLMNLRAWRLRRKGMIAQLDSERKTLWEELDAVQE